MAFAVPLIAGIGAGAGASALGASTLAAVSIGSAALSGVGMIQQGIYQNEVSKNAARTAELNAARAATASQQEALRSDYEAAAALGEQLAAQGASGLDVLGRTQLRARQVTERTGRMAAGDISREGSAAANRLLTEATNVRNEGRQALAQGIIGGVSTIGSAIGRETKSSLVSRAGRRKPSIGGTAYGYLRG